MTQSLLITYLVLALVNAVSGAAFTRSHRGSGWGFAVAVGLVSGAIWPAGVLITAIVSHGPYSLWCPEKRRWLRGAKLWRWTRFPFFAARGSFERMYAAKRMVDTFGSCHYVGLTVEVRRVPAPPPASPGEHDAGRTT